MVALLPLWLASIAWSAPEPEPAPAAPAVEETSAPEVPRKAGYYGDTAVIRRSFGADRDPRPPLAATWDSWGWMRARFNAMTDPPLDEAGTRSGRPWWVETRFVYGVGFQPSSRFKAEIEVEEASANLAGFTDLGTKADREPFRVPKSDARDAILTIPRKAYLQFSHERVGQLRIGAQTFGWGTGMLANDGMGDPVFGDPRQGNTNLRLLLATRPAAKREGAAAKSLTVFAAGDLVIRDDNAWLFRNDLAFAGLLGLQMQTSSFGFGAFGAVRWQKDRPDPARPEGARSVTTAFPVDVYAYGVLTPAFSDHRLKVEAEAAVVQGRSTRPYLVETYEDGASLRSAGMVARVRYDNKPEQVTAAAEVGFATGDNDSRDDVVRSFAFHSDYEVGLILFEQALPLLTARSADRAVDPELVETPTPGARYTINQGQVSNAVYVYPSLRWRPWNTGFDLRAAWLGAWSAGEVSDVFLTGMNGGWNVGFAGQDATKRHLGDEVLLGLRHRWGFGTNLAIELGAEGAVFLPGAAFDALDMPTQGTGRARLDFFW